jgi:hypothetical protein
VAQREEAPGPLGGGGRRGALLAWVAWWLICEGLWLSLVDNTHFHELMVGVVVALIGATAAVLVRSQRILVMRPRARWLLNAWRPLAGYVRELVPVTLALVRGRRGRLVAVSFDAREEDPREAARRVFAKSAGSFAPNAYVVGADEERGLLLVHQLVPSSDPAADVDPLRLL